MRNIFRNLLLLKKLNMVMLISTGLLLIGSVFFIYSACFIREGQDVQPFWVRQIVWICIGLMCYVFFAVIDYQWLLRYSVWGYIVCLALLVIVLIIGIEKHGAQSWLEPFGESGPKVQPSELTKLVMIAFLARMLSRPGVDYSRIKPLIVSIVAVVVPFVLILVQPDLGTAIVFAPMVFIIMLAGGLSLRYLSAIVAVALVSVGLLIGSLVIPVKLGASPEVPEKILQAIGFKDHQVGRVIVFLNLKKDPMGSEYNKIQSQIAVGSGGMWGKGFRNGTQNILGFLPRSIAPTDFIYSVIAEEKGFFGSITVLILFGSIIVSGMRTALAARDKTGRLLCVGVVALIFCHVFINMAMTIGLMPITGLPLPFLSYGGSFMVVMMSAMGIMQSVYIRSQRMTIFR